MGEPRCTCNLNDLLLQLLLLGELLELLEVLLLLLLCGRGCGGCALPLRRDDVRCLLDVVDLLLGDDELLGVLRIEGRQGRVHQAGSVHSTLPRHTPTVLLHC